jgi:hypothetical protein
VLSSLGSQGPSLRCLGAGDRKGGADTASLGERPERSGGPREGREFESAAAARRPARGSGKFLSRRGWGRQLRDPASKETCRGRACRSREKASTRRIRSKHLPGGNGVGSPANPQSRARPRIPSIPDERQPTGTDRSMPAGRAHRSRSDALARTSARSLKLSAPRHWFWRRAQHVRCLAEDGAASPAVEIRERRGRCVAAKAPAGLPVKAASRRDRPGTAPRNDARPVIGEFLMRAR